MSLKRRHVVTAKFPTVWVVRKFWTTKQAKAWFDVWVTLASTNTDMDVNYRYIFKPSQRA